MPLGKAASAYALATAAAPPPLRLGAYAPLPPRSQTGTFADHARQRMVPRPKRLLRQRLRKSPGSSCREAARSSVTPLARIACEARASATASGGIPKGAQPSLASLCLLSAGQKVGARRGPSASKEQIKNLIGVKGVKKRSSQKNAPGRPSPKKAKGRLRAPKFKKAAGLPQKKPRRKKGVGESPPNTQRIVYPASKIAERICRTCSQLRVSMRTRK